MHMVNDGIRPYVLSTVARAREGVRNTSGITPKKQARGGAHLGLHRSRRMPQVGTSPICKYFMVGRSVGQSVGRSVGRSTVGLPRPLRAAAMGRGVSGNI